MSRTVLIFRLDPSLMPILHLGVSGDLDHASLTSLANDVLKNRLERIEGVAVAQVEGGLVSEVEVAVDLQRLSQSGISLNQLQQALAMENLNFSGGQFSAGGREYQVRTRPMPVFGRDGRDRYRQDAGGRFTCGMWLLSLGKEQIITRMNGEPVVSLSIRKQSDANTMRVATAVRNEIKKMEKSSRTTKLQCGHRSKQLHQSGGDQCNQQRADRGRPGSNCSLSFYGQPGGDPDYQCGHTHLRD